MSPPVRMSTSPASAWWTPPQSLQESTSRNSQTGQAACRLQCAVCTVVQRPIEHYSTVCIVVQHEQSIQYNCKTACTAIQRPLQYITHCTTAYRVSRIVSCTLQSSLHRSVHLNPVGPADSVTSGAASPGPRAGPTPSTPPTPSCTTRYRCTPRPSTT